MSTASHISGNDFHKLAAHDAPYLAQTVRYWLSGVNKRRSLWGLNLPIPEGAATRVGATPLSRAPGC